MYAIGQNYIDSSCINRCTIVRQKVGCVMHCVNHLLQRALPHERVKTTGRDIMTLIIFALGFAAEVK